MTRASQLLALLLLSAASRGAGEAACPGHRGEEGPPDAVLLQTHCDEEGLPDTLLLQTQLRLGAGPPGGLLGTAAGPLLVGLGAEGALAHPWRLIGRGGIAGIVLVCVLLAYTALGIGYLGFRGHGPGAARRAARDRYSILRLTLLFLLWEGLCSDQYLANMPDMEADLHTSYSLVSFSVQGIYWIRGIAGLIIGMLSDYFGRRGILVFLFGMLPLSMAACGLAPSGGWFMAARICQGISEGAAVAVAGVIRDIFPNLEERAGAQAWLYMVTMLAPMIAPPIGGALGNWIGWRSVWMLLIPGQIASWLQIYYHLPETLDPQSEGDAEGKIDWREVWDICTSRSSISLLTSMALNMSFSLYNLGNLSLVVQEDLGMSEVATALYVAAPALLCLPGSFLGDMGCQAYGVLKFLRYANFLCALPLALYGLNCIWTHQVWLFLITSLVYPIVLMCMSIPCQVLFMQPLDKAAASAEAIRTVLTMAIGPAVVGVPFTLLTANYNGVRAFALCGVACIVLSMLVTWLGFLISPPGYALEGQRNFDAALAKGAAERAAEAAPAAARTPGEGRGAAGALLARFRSFVGRGSSRTRQPPS